MYSQIFKNDFLLSIPESFLCITCLLLLVYGVLLFRIKVKPNWKNETASQEIHTHQSRQNPGTHIERNSTGIHSRTAHAEDRRHQGVQRHTSFVPASMMESNRAPILLYNVSLLVVYTFMLTLILLWNQPVEHTIFFFYSFATDELSYYLKTLVLLGSIASILMSLEYFKQEQMNAFEYVIFIAFATFSIVLLISAYDLLSVYLTIELQSLAFYSLAACTRESEFSTEAGVKYFMLGALSSGILLFGISLVYGTTGITQLGELAIFLQGVLPQTTAAGESLTSDAGSLGLVFIIVALLFKITAAPFHIWAPDVYEGAPTSVTAVFSIIPKIGVTAILLRLASAFAGSISGESVLGVLVLSGVISIFLGALAGIGQRKIKRLLAFSSIGHVGYILLGISCGTLEGYQASVLYLLVYTVITIASFTVILSLCTQGVQPGRSGEKAHTRMPHVKAESSLVAMQNTSVHTSVSAAVSPSEHQMAKEKVELEQPIAASEAESNLSVKAKVRRIRYIADLDGLGNANPALALSFTAVLFSLAGIPPFAGFFSKLSVFFATITASMYIVSFLAVCATCISCFYYLRMVRTMFFGHLASKPSELRSALNTFKGAIFSANTMAPASHVTPPPKIDGYKAAILAICVFFLLFFFVYPSPLYMITYKVALNLV